VNQVDIYGEPVQLNYRGQSTYKTKLGLIATLATFGLFFGFTYFKAVQLITRSNPIITQTSATLDLINDSLQPNLKNNNFELAIGLLFDPYLPNPSKGILPINSLQDFFNLTIV
jgi:hypothetical protein